MCNSDGKRKGQPSPATFITTSSPCSALTRIPEKAYRSQISSGLIALSRGHVQLLV